MSRCIKCESWGSFCENSFLTSPGGLIKSTGSSTYITFPLDSLLVHPQAPIRSWSTPRVLIRHAGVPFFSRSRKDKEMGEKRMERRCSFIKEITSGLAWASSFLSLLNSCPLPSRVNQGMWMTTLTGETDTSISTGQLSETKRSGMQSLRPGDRAYLW